MEKKNVSFSKWACFDKRDELGELKYPGIYAIAYSDEDISGKDFNWDKEIVYIGMTAKRSLDIRLGEFDKTINGIIKKKPLHNPAGRVRIDLDGEDKDWKKKLYVSVMPMSRGKILNSPEDLICMDEVAKQEYVCFIEYIKKYGARPRFNDK